MICMVVVSVRIKLLIKNKMSDQKIKIQLSPFDAITIGRFLKSFEGEMNHPKLEALKKAIVNYEEELMNSFTLEAIDDAKAEQAMNQLLGREPEN